MLLDLGMVFNFTQIQEWIYAYKYFVIFPLVVVEGPIITVICGFFASTGQLNFPAVYLVIVIGDLVGDSLYYSIGRFASKSWLHRFGKYIGLDPQKIDKAENYFHNHPHKTFALGKLSHGPGILVLVAAGMIKIPYHKFILGNVLPTMVKSLILFLIGFYFGQAFLRINKYLDFTALVIGILFVVAYVVFIKFSDRVQ